MLFRYTRFFCTKHSESFNISNRISEDWRLRLEELNNDSFYTNDRLLYVIKSLYQIGLGAKVEKAKINWETSPAILKSIEKIGLRINELNHAHFFLFVKNVAYLHLHTHPVWDQIEEKILSGEYSFSNRELIDLANCYGNCFRRNQKVWEMFEKATSELILQDSEIEIRRIINLFISLSSSNCVTSKTIEQIVDKIQENVDGFGDDEVCKIIRHFELSKKFMGMKLYNALEPKLLNFLPNADAKNLRLVHSTVIKYSKSEEVRTATENEILNKIETITFNDLGWIVLRHISVYRKFMNPDTKQFNFIRSVKKYIFDNLDTLRAQEPKNFKNEDILFLTFAELSLFDGVKVWKKIYEKYSKSEEKSNDSIKILLKLIEDNINIS